MRLRTHPVTRLAHRDPLRADALAAGHVVGASRASWSRCCCTPWPCSRVLVDRAHLVCCCTPWPRCRCSWDLAGVAAVGHLRALVLHGQVRAACSRRSPLDHSRPVIERLPLVSLGMVQLSHHPCPIQLLCPQHHHPAIFASKSSGSATMRSLSSGPCASSHL